MDRLATILLVRAHLVVPPPGGARNERYARVVEADAAALGWLLSARARDAVASVRPSLRIPWADWLIGTLGAQAGAGRDHVPLYRSFPDTPPRRTDALYVSRVLASVFQQPDLPCVLCAAVGSVQAVSPCAHLVCRECFDPTDYSACPICHRRLDAATPYLQPAPIARSPGSGFRPGPRRRSVVEAPDPGPVRLQRVDLGVGLAEEAVRLRDRLVAQVSPLDAAARDDLLVLIDATAPAGDLGWLPDTVPARETLAVVTAHALAMATEQSAPTTRRAVAARWRTATDIARTLWCLSGGSPGLVVPPRSAHLTARPTGQATAPPTVPSATAFARLTARLRVPGEPQVTVPTVRVSTISRPLRRAVLDRLEALPPATAVEDVLRHRTIWKRLAERLHPFESAATHPHVAVVFSVLRGSRHAPESAAAQAIRAAAAEGWARQVTDPDGRIGAHAHTFGAQVQQRLENRDVDGLLALLGQRPGELLRRVGHLATWIGDDPAGRAAPGPDRRP